MAQSHLDESGNRGGVITVSLGEETLVVISYDFNPIDVRAFDGLCPELRYCPFYLHHFLIV